MLLKVNGLSTTGLPTTHITHITHITQLDYNTQALIPVLLKQKFSPHLYLFFLFRLHNSMDLFSSSEALSLNIQLSKQSLERVGHCIVIMSCDVYVSVHTDHLDSTEIT